MTLLSALKWLVIDGVRLKRRRRLATLERETFCKAGLLAREGESFPVCRLLPAGRSNVWVHVGTCDDDVG